MPGGAPRRGRPDDVSPAAAIERLEQDCQDLANLEGRRGREVPLRAGAGGEGAVFYCIITIGNGYWVTFYNSKSSTESAQKENGGRARPARRWKPQGWPNVYMYCISFSMLH